MRKHRAVMFSGAIALTSLVAVGTGVAAGAAASYGPSAMSSSSTAVNQAGHVVSAMTATLHSVKTVVNGRTETILANAQGLPLYYFQADTAKKSLVNGELAVLWPPLVSAKPTATGLRGTISVLKNIHGEQVTYNGHFLYTFVEDTPGHVTGQGVSNFFVATPRLKAISVVSKTAPAPVTSSGGGYGY
jgi:predicted lipoprotein with Yx(FWY)xxD motif